MWLETMCSMSFDRTQVIDMGRLFSGLFRAPFLNTGVIHAADHWDGKSPVLIDCLYRFVTTDVSSSASSFRSLHGIWSGPAASSAVCAPLLRL